MVCLSESAEPSVRLKLIASSVPIKPSLEIETMASDLNIRNRKLVTALAAESFCALINHVHWTTLIGKLRTEPYMQLDLREAIDEAVDEPLAEDLPFVT